MHFARLGQNFRVKKHGWLYYQFILTIGGNPKMQTQPKKPAPITPQMCIDRVTGLVSAIRSPLIPSEQIAPLYAKFKEHINYVNQRYAEAVETLATIKQSIQKIKSISTATATSTPNKTFADKTASTITAQINAADSKAISDALATLNKQHAEMAEKEQKYSTIAEKTWGTEFDKRCPGVRNLVNSKLAELAQAKVAAAKAKPVTQPSVAQAGTSFNPNSARPGAIVPPNSGTSAPLPTPSRTAKVK